MTTIRQLYELQELDLEIAQHREKVSSIDSQLGHRSSLDALFQKMEIQRASFTQYQLQQKTQDLDAESVRVKLRDVEGKLYGGSVTNIRELEGLEKEGAHLRGQLSELEEQLLEAMVSIDDARQKLQSLEESYVEGEEGWKKLQVSLAEERKGLENTLGNLEMRRLEMVSKVGRPELELYESLRVSRAGQAIARVERGLCRGCLMSLPTHQLQRARMGREPVRCNSCGRILYVS